MNAPRIAGGLAFLLVLWSCSSTPSEETNDLGRAFTVFERMMGSEKTGRPRGTLVDYESTIIAQPDRAAIAKAVAIESKTPPPKEIQELDAELTQVSTSLERLLKRIADHERKTLEFFTRGLEPGQAMAANVTYKAFKDIEQEILDELRGLIFLYLNRRDYGGRWDESKDPPRGLDSIEEMVGANRARGAIFGKIKKGDRYDTNELRKFIDEYTAFLRARLDELQLMILNKAQSATLQMEAAILRGKDPLAVTISPYTTVEGVNRGTKSDRVGVPSSQELERVEKQFDAYGKVAESINQVIEIGGDKEARKKLLQELVDSLDVAAKKLAKEFDAEFEKFLEDKSEKLKALREKAKPLEEAVTELIALVERIKRTDNPVHLASSAAQAFDKIEKLPGLLDSFKTNLGETIDSLTEGTDERKLLDALAEKLKNAIAQLAEATFSRGPLSGLFTNLKALQTLAGLQSFGDVKVGKITKRPFEIRQAPAGIVNLADTPADSGDKLRIKYTVVLKSDTEGQADPQYKTSTFHDVRKFGFYTTYGAQLLFIDRKGDGKSSFRAAPGIGYNLHYRPDSDWGFWDVWAPGLGISVSSPNFETGTELAIGGQLTLLNDMIQLGFARNISVDTDANMLYFGLDLIKIYQESSK